MILVCDQPALRAEHLRSLIESPDEVAGSYYAGSIGVPAYFPRERFGALMELRGDVGARALLRDVRTVNAEELSLDLDTEEDLIDARALLGG